MSDVVFIRGGGDIATGVIQKLYRSGFKVLVLETEQPTAIRRKVALCEAVYDGFSKVEDLLAVLVKDEESIIKTWNDGYIPVVIDKNGDFIQKMKPQIIVDAIIAKRNLGTDKTLAPITIALGPGFVAGQDVDIVVETMRGHHLGRLILRGAALENTDEPGEIGGYTKERVIYSSTSGIIKNCKEIGDIVQHNEIIAYIDNTEVYASISGVLRGIIRNGLKVKKGLKIADIDPRINEQSNCFTISDKARNIGGAVLEAILYLKKERGISNG